MSLDKRLLDILCCPATRQPLALLAPHRLEALNRAILARRISASDGTLAAEPLTAALVTQDGRVAYRIEDGIPVLLVDQALNLDPLADSPA